MNLIVEDGTGLSTANSYATVSEADAYFSDSLHGDDWLAIEDQDRKQNALIRATAVLDSEVHRVGAWYGSKVASTQALSYPRTGVFTADGDAVGSTSVPTGIKQAVIEIARLIATNPAIVDYTGGETGVSLGSTSVTYAHPQGNVGGSPYLTTAVMSNLFLFVDTSRRVVRA